MNSRTFVLVASVLASAALPGGCGKSPSASTTAPAGPTAGAPTPGVEPAGPGAPDKVYPPGFERFPNMDGSTRLYHNDFAGTVGSEWSLAPVSVTPKGERPYLGGFVTDPVTLTVPDLPPHKRLRLTFDLYLIRSWDGSSKTWGEKIWDLSVVGGPVLIHTSFSNCGFFSDNNEQAFPDSFPCRPHPAWTGAAEKQTLGVMQSWGGPDRTFDTSSVYHFELAFPHEANAVTFQFRATMRKYRDKSYGMANVQLDALADVTHLGEAELAAAWKDLAALEAVTAYAAQWKMVSSPAEAVAFLERHLKDPAEADADQVAAWIKELGSGDRAVSNNALDHLILQGRAVLPALKAARAKPDLSAAVSNGLSRVTWWVNRYPETASELRQHRARRVLEIINTPRALELARGLPTHSDDSTPDEDVP